MMHAATLYGCTYTEFMTDYHKLVDSNIHLLEIYDHDAVSVISDPYREAAAFGAKIIFDGDQSPRAERLIHTMEDVERLQNPNVYAHERTLDRIKAVELFRQKLGADFPVIGWVEGPLAEAADLSDVSDTLMDLMIAPEKVKRLMQKTLHTAKDFALAQIKAGANIIGIGDAVCSQIAQEMYDEFCLPLHKELFDFIHSHGALVKLHICGNISHLLPSLAQTDLDILDIDWMVDPAAAYKAMGSSVMICGNVDPVSILLDGSRESILAQYNKVKEALPPENWIFMAGCEIPRHTPQENMQYAREISLHDGWKPS